MMHEDDRHDARPGAPSTEGADPTPETARDRSYSRIRSAATSLRPLDRRFAIAVTVLVLVLLAVVTALIPGSSRAPTARRLACGGQAPGTHCVAAAQASRMPAAAGPSSTSSDTLSAGSSRPAPANAIGSAAPPAVTAVSDQRPALRTASPLAEVHTPVEHPQPAVTPKGALPHESGPALAALAGRSLASTEVGFATLAGQALASAGAGLAVPILVATPQGATSGTKPRPPTYRLSPSATAGDSSRISSESTPTVSATRALMPGTVTATMVPSYTVSPIPPRRSATPTATTPAAATATPTRSPSPTATASQTVNASPTAAASHMGTASPTASRTPASSETETPTGASIWVGTPTITETPANTPTASPTPPDIVLSYSYAISRVSFTIAWRSSYTSAVDIDGVQASGNGQRSYPLATHTYLLVAASLDGTQRQIEPIVVVVTRCRVTVNGRATARAVPACGTKRPSRAITSASTAEPPTPLPVQTRNTATGTAASTAARGVPADSPTLQASAPSAAAAPSSTPRKPSATPALRLPSAAAPCASSGCSARGSDLS